MVLRSPGRKSVLRKPNMREAILAAAEELFATRGFNAVSVRDIAQAAGANPGSVTYHFKTKDGLLLEIYRRHCAPMNHRRAELLAAAKRVRDLQDRLEAIARRRVEVEVEIGERDDRFRMFVKVLLNGLGGVTFYKLMLLNM